MSGRILVVEDNASLARPLVRMLRHFGYDVHHVDSCADARAMTEVFDVGVLDLELPDGLGIDLHPDLMRAGIIRAAVFFTGTMDDVLFARMSRIAPSVRKSDGIDPLRCAIDGALASLTTDGKRDRSIPLLRKESE